MDIPRQFNKQGFRFVRLGKKGKRPVEYYWECLTLREAQKKFKEEMEAHKKTGNNKIPKKLRAGKPTRVTNYSNEEISKYEGNYGIINGTGPDNWGLTTLDADDLERIQKFVDITRLPKTMEVFRGNKNKKHLHFISNLEGKYVLNDPETGKDIGDVRGTGGYQVVGVGSVHPEGGKYKILEDRELAKIDAKILLEVLKPLIKQSNVEKNIEKLNTLKPTPKQDNPFADVRITDVINTSQFRESGGQLFGEHPIHGSDDPKPHNLVVNPSKNTWWCGRHGTGGGVELWIAVEEGIIQCSDAKPGAIRGEKFIQVVEAAERRRLIQKTNRGGKKQNGEPYREITTQELEKIKISNGPGFVNNLPKDHFLTRVIAYGHDISDAYADYWYAGGLYALAVASDKKLMINLRQGTLYPSLYVFIAGKSTLTHKSTAIKKIEELLVATRREFIESKAPTEFSPEAFIEHMHHHNHTHWIRDEASELLGMMQKDYMKGFKGSLMQLYDCSPIHRMLRSRNGRDNTFKVTDPFLNIIWTATDSGLAKNTSANDTLSGFMARFLWHFPNRPKDHWLPLEEGDCTLSIMEDVVSNQLSDIVSAMERIEPTPMHMSKEAASYFTEWQRVRENHWIKTDDEHAMQIYGRLAPTVLKLAMLYELGSPGFDPARPIRLDFIKEACRQIDEYYMPTARRIYESVGADAEKNVIDRILRVLKSKGGKATARTVSRAVKIKKKELDEYIETMVENGMVELFENREGDREGRRALWIVLLSQEDDIENNNKLSNVSIVTTVSNVTNVTDPNMCVLDKRQKRQKDISDISKKPLSVKGIEENFEVTLDNPSVTEFLSECKRKGEIIEENAIAEQFGMTVGKLREYIPDWTFLRGGRWRPPSRT